MANDGDKRRVSDPAVGESACKDHHSHHAANLRGLPRRERLKVSLLMVAFVAQRVADEEAHDRHCHFAVIALGISISLDELVMGFTIGLLHLSLWLAVVLIGAQAFLFSQLGLRLGSSLNESFRERAEQFAGLALLGLAVLLIVEQVA